MLASNAYIPKYGRISPFFANLILERMEFAYVLNVLERVKAYQIWPVATMQSGGMPPSSQDEMQKHKIAFKGNSRFPR